MVAVNPPLVLFVGFGIYAASGPVAAVWHYMRGEGKTKPKPSAPDIALSKVFPFVHDYYILF